MPRSPAAVKEKRVVIAGYGKENQTEILSDVSGNLPGLFILLLLSPGSPGVPSLVPRIFLFLRAPNLLDASTIGWERAGLSTGASSFGLRRGDCMALPLIRSILKKRLTYRGFSCLLSFFRVVTRAAQEISVTAGPPSNET
jgi:hypothetical protein